MSGFRFGVVEIGGCPVVLDSLEAMYVRAQQDGDEALMKILEHRAEVHQGGPCRCDDQTAAPGDAA